MTATCFKDNGAQAQDPSSCRAHRRGLLSKQRKMSRTVNPTLLSRAATKSVLWNTGFNINSNGNENESNKKWHATIGAAVPLSLWYEVVSTG